MEFETFTIYFCCLNSFVNLFAKMWYIIIIKHKNHSHNND